MSLFLTVAAMTADLVDLGMLGGGYIRNRSIVDTNGSIKSGS